MKTQDFDYELPDELIARYPLQDRSSSRLLVLDRNSGSVTHRNFFDLPSILNENDLLVLNNTKVIPARLLASTETRNEIEILLVKKVDTKIWEVLFKKPKEGQLLAFDRGIKGVVVKTVENKWALQFNKEIDDELTYMGNMPLPPYIDRASEESDKVRYQTIYAEHEGAIAAPTAGLHFTDEVLHALDEKGIKTEYITLHVGIGTFRPVKTDNISDHRMHSEFFEISENTSESINSAIKSGKRIVAVGTTVVRALESSVTDNDLLAPYSGFTEIFITPPYRFKIVKGLITNFHLPKSTLLMLVSAFAGHKNTFNAYENARNNEYRFLSYGDAMLIV